MKIVLWLKVFKFMLLAYLLTLILGLGQIIFGVYLGITEIDISETSNEVMSFFANQ